MRTRTTIVPPIYSPGGANYVSVNGGPTVFQGSSPNVYTFAGQSTIVDDPTPSRTTKVVAHDKLLTERINPASIIDVSGPNSYAISGPNCHWMNWGVYGDFGYQNLDIQWSATIPELRAQAMHAFYNRNEVDTLLNIVEAPQFTGSIAQLSELVRRVQAGETVAALRPSQLLRRTARIAKRFKTLDASNLYLMWQFGFAPLISDVQKCMKAASTIRQSLDRTVKDAGKPYVTTAKASGIFKSLKNTGGLTGYSPTLPGTLDGTWWHPRLSGSAIRTVGVKGLRTPQYSSASFQKLDYLMGRFLSPGPISLVWERIPFSFVVDWFVDLSGIVDSLNNTLTGSPRRIYELWQSEKVTCRGSVVKHRTANWTSSQDGAVTCTHDISNYHREPLEPSVLPVLSGRFGTKQATLSAALLHQLVANLKRSTRG